MVEAINLDCYNEFYPSDTNCAGPWHYYDYGVMDEWKEDKSISVHCIGKTNKRTIYSYWIISQNSNDFILKFWPDIKFS